MAGVFLPGQSSQISAKTDSVVSTRLAAIPPNGQQIDIDSEQQGFFSVSGTLINISGGQINLDDNVMLTVYNEGQVQEVLTTPLLADQTFIFHLVPYSAEWSYMASFIHNNIEYKSQIINGYDHTSAGLAEITLWVYDSTSDNSLIRGEGMHVTLEFMQSGYVHVTESMMFVNPSSLVITPVSSKTPVILFELDGQASSLAFINDMDPGIYRVIPGGFGDWQPILPGMVHQVMFEYDLPFDGNTNIVLSLPMRMNSVVVMMEDQERRISCSGTQLAYSSDSPSGYVKLFKGVPGSDETNLVIHCVRKLPALPLILAAMALLLTALVLFLVIPQIKEKMAKDRSKDRENQRTQILDAIIALDDQFKAGQIPRESYTAKRSELISKIDNDQD
jgi:hypothetical protein